MQLWITRWITGAVGLFGCLALLPGLEGVAAADLAGEEEWLACIRDVPGRPDPVKLLRASTPRLILYRDGRILWREEQGFNTRDGLVRVNDPAQWREGQVPISQVARFVVRTRRSHFFGSPEETTLTLPRTGVMHADGTELEIVVGDRGGRVGFEPELLRSVKDLNLYGKTVLALYDTLLALRPAVSSPQAPETIRVYFNWPPDYSVRDPDDAIPPWPLAGEALPEGSAFRTYSGEEAKAVIAALSRSPWVHRDPVGSVRLPYCAFWAPEIVVWMRRGISYRRGRND